MPLFLSPRDTTSQEKMDKADCSQSKLRNTYRQFKTINALLSQWKKIYRMHIRPSLQEGRSYQLLDIGFGGGDIPIKIAQWANRDGKDLAVTAIDTDRRAVDFAKQLEAPEEVTFRHCSSSDLIAEEQQYNFVISNHLLHHLSKEELALTLSEAQSLSTQTVIFNDIRRSSIGYLLFSLLTRPVFRKSFITEDGLTSIQRSYTAPELRQAVPDGWQVQKLFPFRLLLTYHHG
jgi:2-polyprenyl-3-methyl-5-hydroxy-6-metoxy-1,4-benzoquinol methylase